VLDLHVELVMRRLYPLAFFGGSATDETKREVQELLARGITGVSRLTTLAPYAMGSGFSQVDCVASIHLPIAMILMGKVYGQDLTRALPNLPAYLARISERASYRSATNAIQSKLSELGLA
jgi:glutathione S-transferase